MPAHTAPSTTLPSMPQAGAAPLLLQLMQPGASAGCQEAAARGLGNLVGAEGGWMGGWGPSGLQALIR